MYECTKDSSIRTNLHWKSINFVNHCFKCTNFGLCVMNKITYVFYYLALLLLLFIRIKTNAKYFHQNIVVLRVQIYII